MFDIETKLGGIHFSQNIVNKIVMEAVARCDGKAELHNYKGKYKNVVPDLASKINLYDGEAGGIEFLETEDGFEIKVYVVLRFGASIKKTTSEIIDNICDDMKSIFNAEPNKVTVLVTGILSRNIAKRHIEVSRNREGKQTIKQ